MVTAVTTPAVERSIDGCAAGSLVVVQGDARKVLPARCRTWKCPDCGPYKAYVLSRRIALTPARRFITLTWRPRPDVTQIQALDELNACWRTIWKRIKRRQGPRAIGYIRIVEITKAGWPHLHILAQCAFIHASTLSKWTAELIDSPIVDIRIVRGQRDLSRYLSKYLAKQPASIDGRRRYGATPKWLPPKPAPTLEPGELPPSYRWNALSPVDLTTRLILAGAVRFGDWFVLPPEPGGI